MSFAGVCQREANIMEGIEEIVEKLLIFISNGCC